MILFCIIICLKQNRFSVYTVYRSTAVLQGTKEYWYVSQVIYYSSKYYCLMYYWKFIQEKKNPLSSFDWLTYPGNVKAIVNWHICPGSLNISGDGFILEKVSDLHSQQLVHLCSQRAFYPKQCKGLWALLPSRSKSTFSEKLSVLWIIYVYWEKHFFGSMENTGFGKRLDRHYFCPDTGVSGNLSRNVLLNKYFIVFVNP